MDVNSSEQFEVILQGFKNGYRVGVAEKKEGTVTFHSARRYFFSGYRKHRKSMNLDCEHVFAKVHQFYLKHLNSLNKQQQKQFENALRTRKKSLRSRIISWWRKLFISKKKIQLIEKRILAITNFTSNLFSQPQTAKTVSPIAPKPSSKPCKIPLKVTLPELVPLPPAPKPEPPPPIIFTHGPPPPLPPPPPPKSQTLRKIFNEEKTPPDQAPCLINNTKELQDRMNQELEDHISTLKECLENLQNIEKNLNLPSHIKNYQKLEKQREKYESKNPDNLGLLIQAQALLKKAILYLKMLIKGEARNVRVPAPNNDFFLFPDKDIEEALEKNPTEEEKNFLNSIRIRKNIEDWELTIKSATVEVIKYTRKTKHLKGKIREIQQSDVDGIPFTKWEETQKKIEKRVVLYERLIRQRKNIIADKTKKIKQPKIKQCTVTGDLGESVAALQRLKYAAAIKQNNMRGLLERMLPNL